VAKPSVRVDYPTEGHLDTTVPHKHLYVFLLAYRWGSLLLAMWLFLASPDIVAPGISLASLLAAALGGTLLITIFYAPLSKLLLDTPLLIGVDFIFVSLLLAYSGGPGSPYNLYALSPLLTSAFFFHIPEAVVAVVAFSILYPLILFTFAPTVDVGQLLIQLSGAWLVTALFGSVSNLLKQLQQTHQDLAQTLVDLAKQNEELTATYHQLETTHKLMLFFYAPDHQSIQQQLLKAVTQELRFSRALVGLVNPAINRLGRWQGLPNDGLADLSAISLPLDTDDGVIARVVLEQQIGWSVEGQSLTRNESLAYWLEPDQWLLLPLTWQERTVGVLMVAVEQVGRVEQSDDRWAILTSVVSQAAVALGNLDHTQRLTTEQERNRIARELHDTVAQSLFGIVFTLDACIKLLPKQAEAVKAELTDLRVVANKMRQEVRQSILNIWPSQLTAEQFQADLEKYVVNCAPSHFFDLDLTINGDFDGLPAVIRRSLYRVSQEALANTARHAGVDTARLYLYVEPHEVHLSIRDKGRGFDPKQAMARERNREGFGLRGMCERIESLGGSCDILSEEQQGTQVLIRLPLNGNN